MKIDFYRRSYLCLAVTDGMGGYSGGEITGYTYAVDEIKNIWPPFKRLVNKTCDAIHANERIANRVTHEERLAGMEYYCCCYSY